MCKSHSAAVGIQKQSQSVPEMTKNWVTFRNAGSVKLVLRVSDMLVLSVCMFWVFWRERDSGGGGLITYAVLHLSTLNSSLWLFSPHLLSGKTKISQQIFAFSENNVPTSITVLGSSSIMFTVSTAWRFLYVYAWIRLKVSWFCQATHFIWRF